MNPSLSDGFYVTLPSNASAHVFPNNTIAQYRVNLSRHIDLVGDWEVGLAEFSYPHTWFNAPEDLTSFDVKNLRPDGPPNKAGALPKEYDEKKYSITNLQIPEGSYDTAEKIGRALQTVLQKKFERQIEVFYDSIVGRFFFKGTGQYRLRFKHALAHIFGLVSDDWYTCGPGWTSAPYAADIKAGFYHMFVYTDVIQHQLVGDVLAPLLRTVPVTGEHKDTVFKSFSPVYYVPVNRKHIEDITIEVKNDQNRPVKFKYGKVVITLHFRPRIKRW